MTANIRRIDNSIERRVAIGLITDPVFLSGAESMWTEEQVDGLPDWLRLVGEWSFSYWRKYGKAPGRDLEPIYEAWRSNGSHSEESAEIIRQVFRSLSREYEKEGRTNSQYLLDQAHKFLTERSLKFLSDRVRGFLEDGDLSEAEELVSGWRRPERIASVGGDPLLDQAGWEAAYEDATDPLFTFPGSMGDLIGPVGRGEFASFMAPEKRGKTWWLLYTALRALENRCRVAYFQLGDLTQEQVYRRLGTYLAGRSHMRRHCGERWIPILDCGMNQSGECEVPRNLPLEKDDGGETALPPDGNLEWTPCVRCRGRKRKGRRRWTGASWLKKIDRVDPLRWDEAWEAAQGYRERVRDRLRMYFASNYTLRVSDMERILDGWEREDGFVPDVIIGDYWDLIVPEDSRQDYRHQQNDNWSRGRGLSMDRRVALITATQADAKSYDARDLKSKNFSEDKRKYGHVTLGMWTLNQTVSEKKRRLMRIGRLFVREDEFFERDYSYVLQDLSSGRPYVGGWRRGG